MELKGKYGVGSGSLSGSQAVLLAVKPQDLEKTLSEIGPEISDGTLVVSLLAGIKSARIENLLRAFSCCLHRLKNNLMPLTRIKYR